MSDTTKVYASAISRRVTSQRDAIPGEDQVQNNAGGYVYAVDKWQRLTRFLVLGTSESTYYVSAKELTRDNAAVVIACMVEDYVRTVADIVAVSDAGRAPKNDPAILALALAVADKRPEAVACALTALPKVCRIPTHLFHFLAYLKELRGFGPSIRKAVQAWYGRWTADQLAFEMVKYQSRDGWSHRDVLRLTHPRLTPEVQATMRWAIGAPLTDRTVTRKNRGGQTTAYGVAGALPSIVTAFEEAKTASDADVMALIRAHGLTREMVPSKALNNPNVWAALLEQMPLTAMIRNLGKMTEVGLLAPLSDAVLAVTTKLADVAAMKKARVHPMVILNALRVYQQGHGEKGKLTWTPVARVVDALDAAFYTSFGNVTPTNQRIMLALDVSGSMGAAIAGTSLTCREAAAAMALVTANVEPQHLIVGFTSGSRPWMHRGYATRLSQLAISPRQRLDDVVRYMASLDFGGTDCALPMLEAHRTKMHVDAFCIFTDSETWAGDIQPVQALRQYRQAQNRPNAACVVVGMTATEFSIASPDDRRMLDVVGFDTATPEAISQFLTQ